MVTGNGLLVTGNGCNVWNPYNPRVEISKAKNVDSPVTNVNVTHHLASQLTQHLITTSDKLTQVLALAKSLQTDEILPSRH